MKQQQRLKRQAATVEDSDLLINSPKETDNLSQDINQSLFDQMLKQTESKVAISKIAVQSPVAPISRVSEFSLLNDSALKEKRRQKKIAKDLKDNLFASAVDTVEIQASSHSQESFN